MYANEIHNCKVRNFTIDELPEKDRINLEKIKKIVKDHWSFSIESEKRFIDRIDKLRIDEFYINLLKKYNSEDRRIRFNLEEKHFENFDEGWKSFQSYFMKFFYFYSVSYEDFRRNKVTINKNQIKLRKAIINYYFNINIEDGRDFVGNYSWELGEEEDKEFKAEQKKHLEKIVDKRLEIVGARTLPKKYSLELVISFNFADWFLASSNESWGSCLNLESSYDYAYWAGLPGLVIDKNRAMIYITSGKKKSSYDIQVDSIITRSWILLGENDELAIVNWYPSRFISDRFISEITGLEFSESYQNDGDFISKHSVKKDMLYYDNDYSCFIYQDNITFDESGYFRGNRSSEHVFFDKNNGTLIQGEVFSYEEGLRELISYGNTLSQFYYGEGMTCDSCGAYIYEGEEYYFDGSYYCESCYNDITTTCDHCGTTMYNDDAFEFEGGYYCESCYYDITTTCEYCEETIRKEDSIEIDGEHFCDETCVTNYGYKICESCGEYVYVDNAVEIDGKYYCDEDCAKKDGYYICDTCKEFHKEKNINFLNNEEQICEKCLQEEIDKNQLFFEFDKIAV